MILKAFCLLDTKTGVFNTPFFMAHTAQAIRACADLGGDLNTTVGRHPADFALMEIGTFDDQTGTLYALPPHNLGLVVTFLPAAPAPAPLPFPDMRPGQADAATYPADFPESHAANGRA